MSADSFLLMLPRRPRLAETDGEYHARLPKGIGPENPLPTQIFVGNLPFDVHQQHLETTFEEATQVEVLDVRITLVVHPLSQSRTNRRAFAFVTFGKSDAVELAIAKMHHFEMGGCLITVARARRLAPHLRAIRPTSRHTYPLDMSPEQVPQQDRRRVPEIYPPQPYSSQEDRFVPTYASPPGGSQR
ncbi:hypothetical protein FRB90_004821 [Tulasnella sp. 427]|nr:hypothetical protein FRB90_004821 [Tulasnella sp. 427]